jgi:hypothetical protein
MAGVVTATSINQLLSVTAGQALTAGKAVFIGADGKAYLQSSLTSDLTNRFAGFATSAAAANATVTVQATGLLTTSGLTAGSFFYATDGTADQDLSDQTGADTSIYGALWDAQTFTAGSSNYICAVRLSLKKTGTPSGAITVSLRATSSHLPTGADLVSSVTSRDISTLTTSYVNYLFAFATPYPLVSGTEYAIVVRCTGADVTDQLSWQEKTVGGYANGNAANSTDSGANWSTGTTDRNMITYYASGTASTSAGTVSKTVGLAVTTTQLLLNQP